MTLMSKVTFQELCIPIILLSILGSIVFPVPPLLLDVLLIANLIFALALLLTTLHMSEPLKLSSLPTILLLGTLFRLCLNISTTRLILSGGEVGEAVHAFGSFVVQGNIAVGVIVFIVITLLQFMVVAKGAERVAEVSARFALDAMPGKQMSIDADLRAGLCDGETARKRRQEIQTESRFYGALDGAMKFVKGDAIAGILIVLINIIGGLILGIAVQKLSIADAVSRYSLLSIGDGLLAQIPSLLNALAAGLVVTRVPSTNSRSVSLEVLQQLSQSKMMCILVGIFGCLLGLIPGMPRTALFFVGSGILLIGIMKKDQELDAMAQFPADFSPTPTPLLCLSGSREAFEKIGSPKEIVTMLEEVRRKVYDETGILLPRPDVSIAHTTSFEVYIRGFLKASIKDTSSANELVEEMSLVIVLNRVQLLDDMHSRRLLDYAEKNFPELVSNTVPQIISLTQFTEVLKNLSQDGITIVAIDAILQAIAESAPKTQNERQLLEEVRVALGPWVVKTLQLTSHTIRILTLDPVIDLSFIQAERGQGVIPTEYIRLITTAVSQRGSEVDCLVTTKGARRILSEYLPHQKLKVISFEEIPNDFEVLKIDEIRLDEQRELRVLERLAA